MSTACANNSSTTTSYDTNNGSIAFQQMGHRHCRSNYRVLSIHIIIACSGGIKFLVVAIDYFTKWVEAKALTTITSRRIRNFFWEDIVCRFGIPNEIFSNNGTQFEGEPFRSWCQELNIKQYFTLVAHPQVNGQCEVTNRDIVKGIKAHLGLYDNEWADELPSVLRAYHTMHKNSTCETPFNLVYGTEAVMMKACTLT
ncbi:uncharacterized protein [Rutidosis leptorrhynchoides]|uniref:uncharacterized protein n=1 Tax=Rutidosis leptorrhynchoides TaxID=125765 RepID=UPI003A9A4FF5